MGHKYTKEEILEGAAAVAFDDGLSQLTFGRVAKRLGINDRIVVYYFPSKDDLVGDVLTVMGARLQEALAPAFTAAVADHVELVRVAWPVLARDEADPVFALFFEASGLASAGIEPYRTLVPQMIEAWIAWAAELLSGTPAVRRAQAEASIALIDGLLLLRQLGGPAAADRAATTIAGARRRRPR